MILVDTSVWIDHLRRGEAGLRDLLEAGRVLAHPFVLGELAMGNLRQRDVVLGALENLPRATVARDEEILRFVEAQGLFGMGIGYIDAHLLAAVRMSPGSLLWTRDARLLKVADVLSLAFGE